jgi:hypothetical protein
LEKIIAAGLNNQEYLEEIGRIVVENSSFDVIYFYSVVNFTE